MTSDPLAPLREWRQWIVVRLEPLADGKTNKLPLNPNTLIESNAHNPTNWLDYATAVAVAAAAGPGHGVGFVLTANDPFACVDIDSCLQADGSWSPLAHELCAALPGTAVEISNSGRGLHIWARGFVPPHRKKRTDLRIELYDSLRFILLGQPGTAVGQIANECPDLAAFVARYFAPDPTPAAPVPSEGPRAEWNGPTDDDELLRRALASTSARKAFGGNGVASFADLWHARVDVLAQAYPPDRNSPEPYDRSSADAALAQYLAFWTGCDVERIERLMRRSALFREKWERYDYLVTRTIRGACARQRDVLRDPPRPAPPTAVVPDPTPALAAAPAEPKRGHVDIHKEDPFGTAEKMIDHDLTRDGQRILNRWHGGFYLWAPSAAWSLVSEEEVSALVYRFMAEWAPRSTSKPFAPAQRYVMPVLHALKAKALVPAIRTAPSWLDDRQSPHPADLMPVANGVLDLSTGAMLAPTPALWTFNCSPVVFDASAPAPAAWLRFLADLWPGDPDTIAVLQEVFGYLLTPDTGQQKIFLVVGPKRSGKGTIGRVLKELLGPGNVASPSLGSLAERFGLEPLVGKLLALISDARLGATREQSTIAENLLRISGEDAVTVDRKNNPAIPSINLTARVVMLSNEVPRIADASGAMASRFVVMETEQSFYGKEDLGLTSRLLAEQPGILLWAIEGRRRLTRQGHFTQTQAALDSIRQLEDLGSPMMAFIRDMCETGPTLTVSVNALFTAWRQWCIPQGVRGPSDKAGFGKDLHAALPAVRRSEPRRGGSRDPVYVGLALRDAAGPGVGGVGPFTFPTPHTTHTGGL